MTLKNVFRCPAAFGGGTCGSSVFYDWGIQVMETYTPRGPDGEDIVRLKDAAAPANVHICARCTTPYIKVGYDMVDVSEELSAEDVQSILARGQATLPHPKVKDP